MWSASAVKGSRSRCTSGCLGDAMMPIGLVANATASVAMFLGARPMMTRSASLRARRPSTFSRLSMRSTTSMPGNSWPKRTSSIGTKYFAVVTTARAIRPCFAPACSAMSDSSSCNSAITAVARPANAWPASVSRMPRPCGSNSATPNASSSWRMCMETAGCVTNRRSAALDTDPWRATSMKVWICLRV